MSSSSDEIRQLILEREFELRKPGSQLFSQSRYEIQRALGEGGMGITCLAQQISAGNLRRPVVLKFVKDSLEPEHLSQFLNEAQLSILFNHPNLLPVYGLESELLRIELPKARFTRTFDHTIYYTVMQYIDGWNLRQIVDRLRSLELMMNPDIAVYIISRICRGLHYVHQYRDENRNELGLVHRDVSPENILIDRFGRIKVADFGIARAVKRYGMDPNINPGKLLYCSPEQLDAKAVDCRSDIYCVGLLMYFLFTDTDRFMAEINAARPRDRIRMKMKRPPTAAELKHVHPRLAHICMVCLRETPSERYQNGEDLATDLDIYHKDSQKVVTNDIVEEFLTDLFSANPNFVSRRFISIGGTPQLEQPAFVANPDLAPEALPEHMSTVRLTLEDEAD
ncbi:MAG: serine/threonine-protein kinase [Lentisphaeria bacterium]